MIAAISGANAAVIAATAAIITDEENRRSRGSYPTSPALDYSYDQRVSSGLKIVLALAAGTAAFMVGLIILSVLS